MIFDLNGNPTCKSRFIHVKAGSYIQSAFISNISKDTHKISLQKMPFQLKNSLHTFALIIKSHCRQKLTLCTKKNFVGKKKMSTFASLKKRAAPTLHLPKAKNPFTSSATQPAYGPIAQLVRAPDS